MENKRTRIAVALVGMFIFANVYHMTLVWFETNTLQSPIVFQKPWRDRFVSPVPTDINVTPLVSPKKAVVTPKVTPTPTPKKKAQHGDIIGVVEASDIAYPYEGKVAFMDDAQRQVMRQVETTLGKGYAELIFRESGFHNMSVNSIGACGLGQALPCSKMACELSDVPCQLEWVKNYVVRRYGTIEEALAFHDQKGWY